MRPEEKAMLSRRRMLAQTAAAIGLGAIYKITEGSALGQTRGGAAVRYGPINKFSAPSDLRITDMRVVTVASNFDYTIVRLDTNQGVYGLGEIRDGAPRETVLNFKTQVVGKNPMDITGILQSIRGGAGHGRTGGAGYSAIDICLHDIVGKVFGVPIWRLLGDKKRDRIRVYCDTTGTSDPKAYGERMLQRKKKGFTAFKMDITTNFVSDYGKRPDALNAWGAMSDKGLGYACEMLQAVRDAIGWDVPLSVDASSGFRRVPGGPAYMPVPDAIRMARAYEKFDLTFLEDLFSVSGWFRVQEFKEVRAATTTKLATGEDIFGLEEGFKALIDNQAIHVVHIEPGTAGGCHETKRISDYAYDRGIDTAIHMAGSPVGSLASAHSAATLNSFLAQECHAIDFLDWWQKLTTRPVIVDGYIPVPDAPGLGIELNEEVVKEHLRYAGYFEPSPEFDRNRKRLVEGWPHYNVDGKWTTERTSDY
jgi:L-alanine-DL-glutamate epimerase-like enolase superfamily enzyme